MKSVWKIILLAICGFVALSVISSPLSEAKSGMFDFVRKLVIHDTKKLKRIAKEIPVSSVGRKIDPGDIKKSLPDINLKKLTPDVMKMTAVGKKIAESGSFGRKFINGVSKPGEAIRQYSHYGPGYIKTSESFTNTIVKNTGALSKLSPAELKKYGNISKDTIAKFSREDFATSSFVTVVRRTGRHGYETVKKIGNWAKDHPKSASAAALLIWYTTDPEGCKDTVGDVTKFLTKASTDIGSSISTGIGKGISESLMEQWHGPSRKYFLIGIAVLLLILAISMRFVRRIMVFPFKMLGVRLNAYMDKKEAQLDQAVRSRSAKTLKKEKPLFAKKTAKNSDHTPDDKEVTGLF